MKKVLGNKINDYLKRLNTVVSNTNTKQWSEIVFEGAILFLRLAKTRSYHDFAE